MKPNENTFCVLADSPRTGEILARRYTGGDPQTSVRSGNAKWTTHPADIWHMPREDAEQIAGNLRYNNPRFCRSAKAIKRMISKNRIFAN